MVMLKIKITCLKTKLLGVLDVAAKTLGIWQTNKWINMIYSNKSKKKQYNKRMTIEINLYFWIFAQLTSFFLSDLAETLAIVNNFEIAKLKMFEQQIIHPKMNNISNLQYTLLIMTKRRKSI